YIVAGHTLSFGSGDYDFWVLKLDAGGDVQWEKTYGGDYGDYAQSVSPTSDGGYVVAGHTESFGAGGYDFWVLKLDGDGTVQWQKTYGGQSSEEALSIRPTLDGGYIVAGHTGSFGISGSQDAWVLKLDADGVIQWQKSYSSIGPDAAHSIHQTSDRGYVVAGTTSFGFYSDFWVLKTDEEGNIGSSCAMMEDSTATVTDTSETGMTSAAMVDSPTGSVADAHTSVATSPLDMEQQCGRPDFALWCTPPSLKANPGDSDTTSCKVMSLGGFKDIVALSCSG
ncbi:MAG: hypothetical protein GTO40_18125, partial [Deltaproteobacteria bacterium]|nr:hypothetical protein [Deltaproteobacteria bacterium]